MCGNKADYFYRQVLSYSVHVVAVVDEAVSPNIADDLFHAG